MILCVNANAAIDKTVVVNDFRLNDIQRPESVLALPGGKGANVARGLKRLGDAVVVTGWVGGYSGRFIEAGLQREGIDTAFVHVEAESRTCLSVVDPINGTLTEIYERGDQIARDKVAELEAVFRSHIASCSAVTLSGSLPPGVPTTLYADLIEIASEAGVPVFLDSSGEALKKGHERSGGGGGPFLIKPNAREFADLVGHEAGSTQETAEIALDVSRRHGTIVAISRGAEGVLITNGDELFQVTPPCIEIKSAVGSGDCLLAGLAYGLTHGFPLRMAARYGVAAGTANALSVGAGMFSMDDFQRVLAQVDVVDLKQPERPGC